MAYANGKLITQPVQLKKAQPVVKKKQPKLPKNSKNKK